MNNFKHKICWLREQFPWMGEHSGYDLICDYISKEYSQSAYSVYRTNGKTSLLVKMLLYPALLKLKQSETYSYAGLIAELKATLQLFRANYEVTHILYVERTLSLLSQLPKRIKGKLVGTVHQPQMLWQSGRHNPDIVKSLDALIVLSTEELAFFDKYLPGRVHYIPHGIDTGFFKPRQRNDSDIKNDNVKRCIYSGVWLRDLDTLCHIIEKVTSTTPDIQFDLLVPENRRDNAHFKKLSDYSQVHWHSTLTDQQLCNLYQNATLLLLPMKACTANNALLEGAACGLPVVTNDVGGVRDYTNSDFSLLFEQGDADGMADAVLNLVQDETKCYQMGKSARKYVNKNFSWHIIAEKTVQLYKEIL